MRKITLIPVLIYLTLSCLIAQPVLENGKLQVEGAQLLNEHGNSVVLRGVSYGWHNWWPRFYNSGTVNTFAQEWKVSVVRAAMGITEYSDSSYTKNPEWSKKIICNVIDGAIENDIYVIIDWHSHGIYLDEAKVFFDEMSKEYGKYPNVIYEIFNEPVEQSWEEIKNYSIEIINVIRSNDPDNIILVGSPHWDQDVHIVADDPITGYDNIMYTLHFYAATHGEYLFERGNYAISKGLPLFVSESAGMEATGDGPIDLENWIKWIDWMETNKISWLTWSIADKNETCSMLFPSADSFGKWTDKDFKESGLMTKMLNLKYSGK